MSEIVKKDNQSSTSNTPLPSDYAVVLQIVKDLIQDAQLKAVKAVNQALIFTYKEIGATIHKQQQSKDWGTSVVEQLASDLRLAFPGMKGFSACNLWRMRDLYVSYYENEKLTALLAEISWTHHLVILEKCKDPLEREFYIRMSKRNGWTYRVLMNQISNKTYEKTFASQNNFDKSLSEKIKPPAILAMKDGYAFDFLELADEHSEAELERAILSKVEDFLREMGHLFSFVGSQYRLEVGDQEFFIDILLYHRKLKSLIACELKIGAFVPEFVGKMQFYLSVLDDKIRLEGENPSIGIIMCKDKNRTIVEYALKDATKPINVATYQITQQLPKELKDQLPSPEQIAKLLEFLE
jgi:predicted nuclease of restriction endonuclease-like (RecB) superfamily